MRQERIEWPDGAKVALSIVVNVEEGSEMTVARGDRGMEPVDELVTLWNPAGMDFRDVAAELGITNGMVAVTGGQQVFDYFLRRFTRFDLVTVDGTLIPDGVPCFSTGWPDEVLAQAGLRVVEREVLDPGVRLEVWRR